MTTGSGGRCGGDLSAAKLKGRDEGAASESIGTCFHVRLTSIIYQSLSVKGVRHGEEAERLPADANAL